MGFKGGGISGRENKTRAKTNKNPRNLFRRKAHLSFSVPLNKGVHFIRMKRNQKNIRRFLPLPVPFHLVLCYDEEGFASSKAELFRTIRKINIEAD
jgi:hypothetical protein